MEAGSTGSPSKHFVGNRTDKTLIVSCEGPTEDNVTSKMRERILAPETTLQELAGHFIKYQDDVSGILVKECSRLTQQMRDNIQKMIHDQVQSALSGAHADMFIELRAEMKRLLESRSSPMIECRGNTSQKETASTASSEDFDGTVKLRKFMDDMRKEIHEVHSFLNARADAAEKRLEELESGISPQRKEVTSLTKNVHVSAPLLERMSSLSQDASTLSSSSRQYSPVPASSVGRQINNFIPQHSPQPAPIPKMDLESALEKMRTATLALNTERLDDSTDLVTGCSATVSAAGNVRKISAPTTFGYKTPGSFRVPVAGVERNKRPGSIQLRTRDGHISLSVPHLGALSRTAPQLLSPQVAYRSPVPVWDSASMLPLVRSSVRPASVLSARRSM